MAPASPPAMALTLFLTYFSLVEAYERNGASDPT
jgi:hypothetical protein